VLHLLTPTGARPEGMALLARALSVQTYTGPARWIVVDDCDPATVEPAARAGIEVEVVRPAWRWQPGMNTQAQCMAAALARVPEGATCIVLEDDDCYLPDHIATVLAALERAELAGERVARYYNVATRRWKAIPSDRHASLASTACRGAALALLREVCAAGSRRIDMDLWQGFRGPKALLNTGNVVGIKGLPGRDGIGVGHRATFGDPDPAGEVLAEWVGAELAARYDEFRTA
jgi:hypothetical protein